MALIVAGAMGAVVLGLWMLERRNAAFHAAACRADEMAGRRSVSIRAQAMIALIKLLDVRQSWTSEARIRAAIVKDRKAGPALPAGDFVRRFSVEVTRRAGRPIYRVGPRAHAPTGHILYLHGGGFVRSITSLHWEFVAKMVERLNCEVVVPFYPLAPESHVDSILDFTCQQYEAELARMPGCWTVMGDSAGASLALALAMHLRNRGAAAPAKMVLLSPPLDLSEDAEADSRNESDPIVDSRALPVLARLYGPGLDPTDPRLSPLYGDLSGLPSTTIFVGSREVIHPSVQRFMSAAEDVQAPVRLFEYPGMVHVWPLYPIPEADSAFSHIADAMGTSWSGRGLAG